MNIDQMTYGELKQIAAIFGAGVSAKAEHPFVGKYVICRCVYAGVHAGILVSMENGNVILKDSRRLWTWKAKSGVALSGVAQNGFASGQKVDAMNPLIALTDVIECIPTIARTQVDINAS